MFADTLYLLVNRLADSLQIGYFAVTETSLPKFYQVMVLSHTGAGLLLVVLAVAFVELHLPAVWRRSRRRAIATGIVTIGLGLLLTVTGLFILSAANNRENRWAFWSHVGAAALLPLFYLLHRRTSRWKPSSLSYRVVPAAIAGIALVAVALHGITYVREAYTEAAEKAFAEGTHLGAGSKLRDVAEYAPDAFVPANYVPAGKPVLSRGDHDHHRILPAVPHHHARQPSGRRAAVGRSAQARFRRRRADRCRPVRRLPRRHRRAVVEIGASLRLFQQPLLRGDDRKHEGGFDRGERRSRRPHCLFQGTGSRKACARTSKTRRPWSSRSGARDATTRR